MRLCNASIHYFLFLFLSLSISQCYGHEHHNHVDPVTTKYSQSATPTDPLSKSIETTSVHQLADDDHHHHETIDARLRVKHNLRQSVHQHSDDDREEDEQAHINRLNSALEDYDDVNDHQFQHAIPPTKDLVNNTQSQNQTTDDIQRSPPTLNDTASTPPTSIQPPIELQQPTERPLVEDNQKTVQHVDQVTTSTTTLNDIVSPPKVQLHEQRTTDTREQDIIEKETLLVHGEALSSTQLHQEPEILSLPKTTSDSTPPIPVQQTTPTSTVVLNETAAEPPSVKSDEPSTTSTLHSKEQPIASDAIRTDHSTHLNSTPATPVQQTTVTSTVVLNETVVEPPSIKSDAPSTTSTLHSEEEPIASDAIRTDHPTHPNSTEQPIADAIQNASTVGQNATSTLPIEVEQEPQKLPDSVRAIDPVETQQSIRSISEDAKLEERKSNDQAQPTTPDQVLSTPPTASARILRSSTPRIQQKAHGRHQLSRSNPQPTKTAPEPETTQPTETTNIQPTVSSTPAPVTEQPTESSTPQPIIETAEHPSIDLTTDIETIARVNHTDEVRIDNEIETPMLTENTTQIKSDSETSVYKTEVQIDTVALADNETQAINATEILPTDETETETEAETDTEAEIEDHDQTLKPIEDIDLPRQVHVHDPTTIFNQLKEEADKNEQLALDQEVENNSTASSFLANDHSPHLPRILESDEVTTTAAPMIEVTTDTTPYLTHVDSNLDDAHGSATTKSTHNDSMPIEYRQVCWRLPKPFESSLVLIENQVLRFVSLLPEYVQTIFYDPVAGREKLANTIWFSSICAMCFLFSFMFLSMGAKRLKQSQDEKKIRAVCQQLQQHNNQLVLERDTFEKQNQKLSDEIDALRNIPINDSDEEIFELREKYDRLHADWQLSRAEYDAAAKDIDYKQSVMQKHEFEMQKQVETVAYLNDEILRQKQELEKERETIARLQSNDLSLERFETLQQTIHDLKAEISQLKQEKFAQTDELQLLQDQAKQLDLDKNQLTNKMKQLKDLLQQRDETIARIRLRARSGDRDDDEDDDHDEERTRSELNSTGSSEQSTDSNQKELLSKIDDDVEKANQHLRDLHAEIEEKTRRTKELDALLTQEKDRCRELETKLKVVLELRERDAHLHIRQLGQTDAELRKARTDTERVRILQQQLQLKEQQLDDVQKVLNSEQTKFSEECSKLQHQTHEKWMEVKRLTRELDGARKECESLRRQISKYGNSERSSQEKTMHKPVPQHANTGGGRKSNEPEINGSSPPPPLPYQQGDNFRPIDHERNDSGAASPSEMFRIRPPLFGLPRPPFYPPPFMPPPPPNPFLMGGRFAMSMGAPHGMISPISHLITNGSGGGSDANSFEIVDSANITPNSTSYDAQLNGSAASPTPDGDQQATSKVKKPKKSLKKKTKTSNTTVAPSTKEDV